MVPIPPWMTSTQQFTLTPSPSNILYFAEYSCLTILSTSARAKPRRSFYGWDIVQDWISMESPSLARALRYSAISSTTSNIVFESLQYGTLTDSRKRLTADQAEVVVHEVKYNSWGEIGVARVARASWFGSITSDIYFFAFKMTYEGRIGEKKVRDDTPLPTIPFQSCFIGVLDLYLVSDIQWDS